MKEQAFFLMGVAGLCAFLLFYLGRVAKHIGLVDTPDSRKQHHRPIPLIGGLAIWLSLLSAALLAPAPLGEYRILFFCILLVLVTGLLDDYKEISARARIVVQIIAAVILVYFGEVVVRSLGEVFFIDKPYGLGVMAVPFSIVAIVGTINAFNMSDGHDGLAGLFLLIVFISLALLSFLSDDSSLSILIVIIASLIPFLVFNLPEIVGVDRQVFLGDAGSMSLGLLAAFLLVDLSSVEARVLKVTAAPWIIAIPLLDMVGVMIFRVREKKSPFHSDRFHIHHLLLGIGWSKNKVLVVLVLCQSLFASVGIAGTVLRWNDGVMMWSCFVILGIYLILTARLRRKVLLTPH